MGSGCMDLFSASVWLWTPCSTAFLACKAFAMTLPLKSAGVSVFPSALSWWKGETAVYQGNMTFTELRRRGCPVRNIMST